MDEVSKKGVIPLVKETQTNRGKKTLSRREFIDLAIKFATASALPAWLVACTSTNEDEKLAPSESTEESTTISPVKSKQPDLDPTTPVEVINPKSQERREFVASRLQNPKQMITAQFNSGTTIIGLGESHWDENIKAFIADTVEECANENLIGFLALEVDLEFQDSIDKYLKTGIASEKLQTLFKNRGTEYKRMLNTARNHNLSIVCAGSLNTPYYKDRFMKDKLMSYIERNPNKKGFFIAGSFHIFRSTNLDPKYSVLFSDQSYFPVHMAGSNDVSESDLRDTFESLELENPQGIHIENQGTFNNLFPNELWSSGNFETDAVIFVP